MLEVRMGRRAVVGLGLATLLAAAAGPSLPSWERCAAAPGSEIFSGIVYGCEWLPPGPDGRGIVHWVRVDLAAPGIELYITPLDPAAVGQGWQYRLRSIGTVVDDERLAVAVNGTLFTSPPRWRPRLPGDLARGVETVVSDHTVSHLWEHTYLLWFDDHLAPHLRPSKPPTSAELQAAKWGIGGQGVGLQNGQVWPGTDRRLDARTGVAIDQQRKLLFLAVAERISPHRLLETLADIGAREGMLLDGGGSSAMAIGEGAHGIPAGALFGGSRPVATYFGVRARPVASAK
jgi:hypothetical protein